MSDDYMYTLGNRSYRLKSQNAELLKLFSKLLPHYTGQKNQTSETIDLDNPQGLPGVAQALLEQRDVKDALVPILNKALSDHAGHLWLDGCVMVLPDGRLVLITGPSHSGKTTLSLSLAITHHWKILTEDVVLINPTTNEVAPFNRPLSLRPDTVERIKAAGVALAAPEREEWLFDQHHYHLKPAKARFCLSVNLEVITEDSAAKLNIQNVTTAEFLRKLAAHSNALRLETGLSTLEQDLGEGPCFLAEGGSLAERIDAIVRLTNC